MGTIAHRLNRPPQFLTLMHDLIIGGGFSGLAAAVELATHNREVILLERRSFLGGRAYSFTDRTTGDTIDNGQHLLMGCYHDTIGFLKRIGASGNLKFQKRTRVEFLHPTAGSATFSCPKLPAPMHLLAGLARLSSLRWTDRLAALRVGLAAQNGRYEELADVTVREWLSGLGQSRRIQERFWDPLALATLNESPARASADMFVRVIHDAFLTTYSDSQIVISRVGLSDLYTRDAARFIEGRGGTVRLNADVERIDFSRDRATTVVLRGGERLEGRSVTSAVPPGALARMLPDEVTSSWKGFRDLGAFRSSPIVSINLWYDREVTTLEFAGLQDSRVDWVFNKNAISGKQSQRQHLALVISGAHAVSRLTKDELIQLGDQEVRRFFPSARQARLLHSFVVREHEATISHTVGVARLRPPQQTPMSNFFLAGDWTQTGLPATIEGAVRSGQICARSILERTG
ncbi:MAG: hydroxysqualene dehydroxylase HpnE [Acidobacteriota bacterium]